MRGPVVGRCGWVVGRRAWTCLQHSRAADRVHLGADLRYELGVLNALAAQSVARTNQSNRPGRAVYANLCLPIAVRLG